MANGDDFRGGKSPWGTPPGGGNGSGRGGQRPPNIDEVIEIIKTKHNFIRHHVGLNIELKYIPQLRFYYDDSLEHAQRIDDLIVGNATPEAEQGLNIGRMISLMGLDTIKVPGMTVNRYCSSGLETIAIANAKKSNKGTSR